MFLRILFIVGILKQRIKTFLLINNVEKIN